MEAARTIVFHREALPPLAKLEHEWRSLETAGTPSFFTSWHWIGTLLSAVPAASRPSLLRGVADRATVALALLGAGRIRRRAGLVRSRTLHLNETGNPRYDGLTIEHNAILAASGWDRIASEALIAWFARLADEADELYVSGAPLSLPEAAIARFGLAWRETAVLPSYWVGLTRLRESGGDIAPLLSANARQQLRRAVRHFERWGPLDLSEAATVEEALDFFTGLKALHCASWERRGTLHSFTGAFFEPFHRLLIARSFAAGGTQLVRARVGRRTIGYLYNFRLGNHVYAYQSGFDDADRRERPGVVTHALAIRHAFRSGAQVYDFMAGRNRLKESFATCCAPMRWQVVQHRRLGFRLENLARRLKQAIFAGRDPSEKSLPPAL